MNCFNSRDPAGRDKPIKDTLHLFSGFNSRDPAGRDVQQHKTAIRFLVSTHATLRVATMKWQCPNNMRLFQLTRPCGSRPWLHQQSQDRDSFNSRDPAGRDTASSYFLTVASSFNSRDPAGRDL